MRPLLVAVITLLGVGSASSQPVGPPFINGVDVSFLDHFERNGVNFKHDGETADVLDVLKENGVNTIRLRLWHTPSPAYAFNGLDATLIMAKRVREAGFAFMLDFHYSDWWADPGKQFVPAAWSGLDFTTLKDSLFSYTRYVISRMSAQGTVPEIVQLGNEISQGMLWDYGRVGGSFDNAAQWGRLAQLIQAADSGLVAGLGENDVKPEVMIHTDRGGDPPAVRWFFDNLTNRGVDFDLIGLSYYPFWHGPLSQLEASLRLAAERYGKDVVVAETAYPWTLQWFDDTDNFVWQPQQLLPGYPASPKGQYDFLIKVKEILRETPTDHGRGFVYWEPTYVAAPWILGSPWENLTLFDNTYNALESLAAFNDGDIVSNESSEVPTRSPRLTTAFPNPFSSSTTIRIETDSPASVDVELFDLTGREIRTLASGVRLGHGPYLTEIDGSALPVGTYVVRVTDRELGHAESILIQRFR